MKAFAAAGLAVVGALAFSHTATAAESFISCPVNQLDAGVTSSLPENWWFTPQRGELIGTEISSVAGRKVLVCNYRGFGGSIAVMRDIPAGFNSCKPVKGGFRCVSSGAAEGDGSVRNVESSQVATQAKSNAKMPTKGSDDSLTAATQAKANAPVATGGKDSVTSTTQAELKTKEQVKAPAPPADKKGGSPTQPATPVSEVKPNQKLQQQALNETTKQAVKETTKSRVYAFGGEISFIGDPVSPLPLGTSATETFCRGSSESRFGIVRLRYEWRPSGDYVPEAYLITRLSTREVSTPVGLSAGSGQVAAGVATAPLTGLLTLSKADLCPSGCLDARLAPRTAADANRFDQRWQRACLR